MSTEILRLKYNKLLEENRKLKIKVARFKFRMNAIRNYLQHISRFVRNPE